jgi:perosamine synthetase
MKKIKLGCPYVGEEEIKAVGKVLNDKKIAIGHKVEQFENIFSDYISRNYGVAVCSGSFALELALKASELNKGDRVLVSPFNCGAVLYSLINQNLQPVWTDIDIKTYNISPDLARKKLEENYNIQGILITHLYGHPCEMDEFLELKKEFGLILIEDFAQAPGALYKDRTIGSYGELSICSFGATKNLTTATGGMILTDKKDKLKMLKYLRDNTSGDFEYTLYNCKMNDIQAAIGVEQIKKYDYMLETRRKIADYYSNNIENDYLHKPEEKKYVKHAYHSYILRLKDRHKLRKHLIDNNIESAFVYRKPLHQYKLGMYDFKHEFAEKAANEVISLPIHPHLTDEEIEQVTKAVNTFRP